MIFHKKAVVQLADLRVYGGELVFCSSYKHGSVQAFSNILYFYFVCVLRKIQQNNNFGISLGNLWTNIALNNGDCTILNIIFWEPLVVRDQNQIYISRAKTELSSAFLEGVGFFFSIYSKYERKTRTAVSGGGDSGYTARSSFWHNGTFVSPALKLDFGVKTLGRQTWNRFQIDTKKVLYLINFLNFFLELFSQFFSRCSRSWF